MTLCQDMSYPMIRILSTFHVIIWDMTTPLHGRIGKFQHNKNAQLFSPPHPSVVPHVALGSVSIDDTKIIE